MVKFKGRLGIVQYMPLKPDKRWLKIWMLCTSHLGYTVNFELYAGKRDKIVRSGKGLGYDVVTHLIKPLTIKGHELYVDRFFTSVQLMVDLLKYKFYSCGTVMPNRKHLLPEIKTLKLKIPNESQTFQNGKFPNLFCTSWVDKKQIFMLSTNTKNELCHVNRRKGADKIEVLCPRSFAVYNTHMGGVDLADQRRKYYTVARKSSKWWMCVFWFLLDITINNAYIIQHTTNYPQQKR
ncbi:PiggyBac transposable element-derived protein 4, partial [Stegodyphus mimosarum]